MTSLAGALPSALAGLYARVPFGMRLGLERMRAACDALGNPERSFAVVHVAGTNGKGSVSAMVEASLRAAGKRTGLYTSPHLCRFAERIQLGGEPIDDQALAEHLVRALGVDDELSFFEVATLSAFLAFQRANVDVAVLEVGLGGRLDATNVVPSALASAVTRIALDHTAWLGETEEAIAREKAAIAKPGLELTLGPMRPSVRAAIDEVAHAAGATTFGIEDDPDAQAFGRTTTVPLAGDHQRENAALAYRLARLAGAPREAIVRGVAGVRWPGRLERIQTPTANVLLDAAHNPDGARSLARYLTSLGPPKPRLGLVFGTLADKAWPEMIDVLAPLAATRVYVLPRGRAATDPAAIAARHPGAIASDVGEAIRLAAQTSDQPNEPTSELVVVCGSIFLVGEARALLLGLPRDPPVAL